MGKFVKRSILFLLPIFLIAAFLEAFIVYYPSAFNTKASFIKSNYDIELLILGSSHNQQAINPQYLKYQSANLAYGGQDLEIDTALFWHYAEALDSLKILVVELDYHTLEFRQPKDYFRLPWYYKFHSIKIGEIDPLRNLLLYPTSPSFFNNYILDKFSSENEKVELNKWGYETNRYKGEFEELNYNEEAIEQIALSQTEKRHQKPSPENLKNSKAGINKIVEYCAERNIQVLLISSPMYKTYLKIKTQPKEGNRMTYIDSLVKVSKNVSYLNYESDSRFIVKDFRNEDHLNPDGAKKFTVLLNNVLDSISRL